MSENGRIFFNIIQRQNLSVLNANKNCQGTITRHRKTVNGDEISVLDFMLACDKLAQHFQHFQHMMIDESRHHVLTKYASTKGVQKKCESDHNIMYAKFLLTFQRKRAEIRRDIFNFRDLESLKKFSEVTEGLDKFQHCFTGNKNPEEISNNFS